MFPKSKFYHALEKVMHAKIIMILEEGARALTYVRARALDRTHAYEQHRWPTFWPTLQTQSWGFSGTLGHKGAIKDTEIFRINIFNFLKLSLDLQDNFSTIILDS